MTDSPAIERLLACPFCGGSPIIETANDHISGHGERSDDVRVRCQQCNANIAKGSYSGYEVKERTAFVSAKWNTRAAAQPKAVRLPQSLVWSIKELEMKPYKNGAFMRANEVIAALKAAGIAVEGEEGQP